jgi:hypothetical protein
MLNQVQTMTNVCISTLSFEYIFFISPFCKYICSAHHSKFIACLFYSPSFEISRKVCMYQVQYCRILCSNTLWSVIVDCSLNQFLRSDGTCRRTCGIKICKTDLELNK